jgi:hypothetical protein
MESGQVIHVAGERLEQTKICSASSDAKNDTEYGISRAIHMEIGCQKAQKIVQRSMPRLGEFSGSQFAS